MALLLFILIKVFVFDIVKINSSDMLSTFNEGDTFLIKKLANTYMTNDLVYFTYPQLDSTLPAVSVMQRLIALPGDTVQIIDKKIYLNNVPLKDTNTLKYNYFIKSASKLDTFFLIRYNLVEGGPISDKFDFSYSLTRLQADSLKKNPLITKVEIKQEKKDVSDETVFPYSSHFNWNMDNFGKLYVPKKNDTLTLDSITLNLYAYLIVQYERNTLWAKGDSVFINDVYQKKYTVKQDYYFLMGDNRDNANDSRVCGFIPEQYIKGKAVWLIKRNKK